MITFIVNFIFSSIKNIVKILVVLIIIAIGTCGVDYLRMSSGQLPIFCVAEYNSSKRVQTFQGILYKAERHVRASSNEALVESNNIKFKIVNKYSVKIPSKYTKEVITDYQIETKETKECREPSKLYYADEKIKVYTYCLDSITINNSGKKDDLLTYLKNDPEILDKLNSKLAYKGLSADNSTQIYTTYPDTKYTNNGLTYFKCDKLNIDDVYIGPKDMQLQEDFCTYKDDDFKYIYKITEDEHPKNEIPEIFYEDLENNYQFNETKSQFVYITIPAIRGRQETKINIKQALINNMVTINELKEKGLQFEVIPKNAIQSNS